MTHPNNRDWSVREATTADIPQISEVWWEFMLFHADLNPTFTPTQDGRDKFAAYLEEQLAAKSSLLLVAHADDSIVGYCLAGMAERPPVLIDCQYGMINDLAVVSSLRRRGIGEALLKSAEEWFKAAGINRVELQVMSANDLGRRFWTKMGYAVYLEKRFRDV